MFSLSLFRLDLKILIIFIGILLIISTFLQSLKEFLNLEKNIRQYITIIKNNQIIILDIQEQLNQQLNDRIISMVAGLLTSILIIQLIRNNNIQIIDL